MLGNVFVIVKDIRLTFCNFCYFKVLFTETLHTTGVCLLIFYALPHLDSIRALACMASVALVPAMLKLLNRPADEPKRIPHVLADALAICGQLTGLIWWTVLSVFTQDKTADLWALPVGLLLISVPWWENYVDRNTGCGGLTAKLLQYKKDAMKARTVIYVFVSVWKIALTLGLMLGLLVGVRGYDLELLFNFSRHKSTCPSRALSGNNWKFSVADSKQTNLDWLLVWLLQFIAGFVCYMTAKVACKVRVQRISFSLALVLSTPIAVAMVIGGCEMWNIDPFYFSRGTNIPLHTFFSCHSNEGFLAFFTSTHVWAFLIWWFSYLWICLHIWFPRAERLAKTEK